MQPKVSVIIPVYNVEKYLRKCLDSVFGQTIAAEIEVVCVDDGSTDGTGTILDEYAALHSNLIVARQQNAGSSVARNRALDLATGEYISFVDSDDWYSRPDALELLYARATELRLDELFFDINYSYDSEALRKKSQIFTNFYHEKYGEYPDVLDGREMFLRLRQNNDWLATLWSRIYRRAFLEEHHMRFYPGILHQDNLFVLKCTCYTQRSAYYRECFYNRLFRPGSSMMKDNQVLSCYSNCIISDELTRFAAKELADAGEDFKREFQVTVDNCGNRAAWSFKGLSQNGIRDLFKPLSPAERKLVRRQLRIALPRIYATVSPKVRWAWFRISVKRHVPKPLWSFLKKLKRGRDIQV